MDFDEKVEEYYVLVSDISKLRMAERALRGTITECVLGDESEAKRKQAVCLVSELVDEYHQAIDKFDWKVK